MKTFVWEPHVGMEFRLDPPPTPRTKLNRAVFELSRTSGNSSSVLRVLGQTLAVQTTQNIEHFPNGDFRYLWSSNVYNVFNQIRSEAHELLRLHLSN